MQAERLGQSVPFWPSAYFWPVITRKFRDYGTGYEAFKQQQQQQLLFINIQRRKDCSVNSIASLGGTVLQNNYKNFINLQEETYIIFKQIVPNH